eukprot:TRINITY_DN71435_c0_g1_i1.p1 TRINITY_DN71435_c0_g1~~TRINITY_DN71435_c0_g1_i1.p1  ORF type:complete len:546 (-),score=103.32 TRINITY_DN71435_c0_g1_i1:142-1683(-)
MDLLNRPRSRGALKNAAGQQKSMSGLQKQAYGAVRSRAAGCRSRSTHRRLGCDARNIPCFRSSNPLRVVPGAAVPAPELTPSPPPAPPMEEKDLLVELGICSAQWVDQLIADAEEPDEASMLCEWDETADEKLACIDVQDMYEQVLSSMDDDAFSVASFDTEADDEDESSRATELTKMLVSSLIIDACGAEGSSDVMVVDEADDDEPLEAPCGMELPTSSKVAAEPNVEALIIAELEKTSLEAFLLEEDVDDDEYEDDDAEEADAWSTSGAHAQVQAPAKGSLRDSTAEVNEKPLVSRRRRALIAAGANISATPNQYASAMAIPTLAGRGIAAVRGLRQHGGVSFDSSDSVRARQAHRRLPKHQSTIFHQLETTGDSGCESEVPANQSKKSNLIESYDALGAQFYNMDDCGTAFCSSQSSAPSHRGVSAMELDLGFSNVHRPLNGKLARSPSESSLTCKGLFGSSSTSESKATRGRSCAKTKSSFFSNSNFKVGPSPLQSMRACSATRSSVGF